MKAENDYKKQIRELQSALAIERHKNSAMAKGLIPKEYLQNYARIQIEKDRSETKRLMNEKLKDFEGLNPEIEAIIEREITLD
jgi:hypothetical protein